MRVLVAEDDPLMREMYEELLRASGHEPTCCADGKIALAEFEREPFPMVMVDWQMPEMDGLELCRRIRGSEAGRATFILMVTAVNRSQNLSTVLDDGADDYLSKPVTAEDLWARITIAERHIALDKARRQAENALAKARWLAGIGETSLAVQHEINNPLAALLGATTLLEEEEGAAAADQQMFINTIVESARRIAEVVQRLANLKDPRTIEYLRGSRMLDLSKPNE